jgi:hypothetical protein
MSSQIRCINVFALAAALGACASAYAQGAIKPIDAMIVNPPTRPVPVAVMQGVNIGGTVNIRNVDEPGRSPYAELFNVGQVQQACSTTGGNFQRCVFSGGFSVVPAGKRLVLTHAAGIGRAPTGCKLATLELHTSSVNARPGSTIAINYLSFDTSPAIPELGIFSHPITAYVEAGSSIDFQVDASCAGIQAGSQSLTLSGYFVTLP